MAVSREHFEELRARTRRRLGIGDAPARQSQSGESHDEREETRD